MTGKDMTPAKALLAEARRLATAIPIDGERVRDKDVKAAFTDKTRADAKSKLEMEGDPFARTDYAKAKEAAGQAGAAIR